MDGTDFIRDADISPSGSRAVFEIRGEIVTVPAEKGDPRNLTLTAGAHERGSAWSPDGASIAYFSDASGEYELAVAPQNGKGEVQTYALTGTGFYNGLQLVARLEEDRLRGQRPQPLLHRSRFRRDQEDRSGAHLQPRRIRLHGPGVVARLGVDRLHHQQHGQHGAGLPLLPRKGRGLHDRRRAQRRRRPGLRRGRQVPLLLRLHRRRTGSAVVRHVQRRHGDDPQHLPGHPAEGRAVAVGHGERRRGGEGRRSRGRQRRERRKGGDPGRHRLRRAGQPHPRPPDRMPATTSISRPARKTPSSTSRPMLWRGARTGRAPP